MPTPKAALNRVDLHLLDYRDLPQDGRFDKIVSVGMFEHVGHANLSRFLQSTLLGSTVSQYREDNELIEILLRGTPQERTELSLLPSLSVPTDNGQSVALSQIATLEYGFEEGIIWHRNRSPGRITSALTYKSWRAQLGSSLI